MALVREFFIPDVGAVSAEFFQESRELFVFLDARGEIQRVQGLVQLGIVQHAWPMARHTRWDFTMLMLDLIRRAKELPSVHLTSKARIDKTLKLSSTRELLTTWALLLNLGHLHGTFTTETELLFGIARHPESRRLKDELLSAVPAGEPRSWAAAVVEGERTFQFHQVLAFYRLQHLARSNPLLPTWQRILGAYVAGHEGEGEVVTRARDLFRRIRRLTYLTLDSSVTPSPVEVRLLQLASAPQELSRLLTPPDDWGGEDELVGLEEFLNREVYNGRDSLAALARLRPELRRRFSDALNRNGLTYTVEFAAKTVELLGIAREKSKRVPSPVARGAIGGPAFALAGATEDFGSSRRRMETAYERWARAMGRESSLVLARNASGSQIVFQTHAHGDAHEDVSCALAGAIRTAERVRRKLHHRFPGLDFPIDQVLVGATGRSLATAGLRHFFPDAGRWEWRDEGVPPACLIGSRAEVQDGLDQYMARARLSRARRHELAVVRERLTRFQASIVVVPIANAVCYSHDDASQKAELDGVILGVDGKRGDLVLGLVEAKDTAGAKGASHRQLSSTLATLGRARFARPSKVSAIARGRQGQAWVYLRSGYGRVQQD